MEGTPDRDVPAVVFSVGNGDHIYTKHPPLPPADVIRQDVRLAIVGVTSVVTSSPTQQICLHGNELMRREVV